MKKYFLLLLINTAVCCTTFCQPVPTEAQQTAIHSLIDQYSLARETSDTILLKKILTSDIDQLVSNGEWRNGIDAAVAGMIKSSASSPGKRTLTVDKIKLFSASVAVADCRYEITSADGSIRKMWSSFVVVENQGKWKISAIRNMLPAAN
ncbi:MAG: hypothetical protein QM764_18550 [Chitinophagaceae bacterium]